MNVHSRRLDADVLAQERLSRSDPELRPYSSPWVYGAAGGIRRMEEYGIQLPIWETNIP
jgi:hypothetical protein